MGWEYRGANGPYYTRSKRVNGRVTREYVGGGIVALAASLFDEEDRDARAADRAERARHAELDRSLTALSRLADTLTAATLEQAGYFRHHRGQWRRRRDQGASTDRREQRRGPSAQG